MQYTTFLSWLLSCDIYQMYFHFAVTLHKYQKGENLSTYRPACCRCSVVHDVGPTPTGLRLTFTIFCLETPLCFMQECSSPIERKCICTNYWFPHMPYRERERMSPCICKFSLTYGFSFNGSAHTCGFEAYVCVFVCTSPYVCLTTHGFMHICTVFAFGEKHLCLC